MISSILTLGMERRFFREDSSRVGDGFGKLTLLQ